MLVLALVVQSEVGLVTALAIASESAPDFGSWPVLGPPLVLRVEPEMGSAPASAPVLLHLLAAMASELIVWAWGEGA